MWVVALSFLERSEEMARMEAMAKMGYYPTPEELIKNVDPKVSVQFSVV